MLNKLKFKIFYWLYRFFNDIALKCYEIYWNELTKMKWLK